MHKLVRPTLLAGLLGLAAALPVQAQTDPDRADTDVLLLKAERYMAEDQAAAAEEVLDRILERSPELDRALLRRATLRAWRGDYAGARADYGQVLARTPEHLEALVGLGYAEAWAGRYDRAEGHFKRALQVTPDQPDARKGLAYTALWRGDSRTSVELFQALEASNPGSAEVPIAIGQAELQALHARRAELAFRRALAVEPDNGAARDGLKAAYAAPARAELSIWVGNTTGAGSGLRQVELASWLDRDWRVWLRFDDSLTQDNQVLQDRGDEAQTWYAGALHQFDPQWLGVAEIGRRELPESQSQDVYKLESVRLQQQRAYKFGFQVAPHSEDFTDKLGYAGIDLPLTRNWRFEPTLYLARSGAAQDREWRVVGLAKYRDPADWELSIGLGTGDVDADDPDASGGVNSQSLTWRRPLGGYHSIAVSLQRQETPSEISTTTMVGITLRLPRN